MDFIPDDLIIKQEEILEDIDDCLEFCFDAHVKVENDIEWPPIQTVLAPVKSENHQDTINYDYYEQDDSQNHSPRNKESSASNEENINYKEFKDNLQSRMLPVKSENHQDTINYDYYEQDDSQNHSPRNKESSASNEENINYKEFKDNLQSRMLQKYQEQVIYQKVKEESSQTCMLCRKYFTDSKALFQHNLCHLKVPLVKQKLYMCEYCTKYCKKKVDLIKHIKINHKRQYSNIPITKQKHKCSICNKTYSYKAWFSHKVEVHGKGMFECNKCHLTFKCKRYLTRHNRIHDENRLKSKPYHQMGGKQNCPKCPAILNSKYAVTTHLRNCHSNDTFKCYLCNSTLKCMAYLRGHMIRVHHNDGMLHACELCGKEFKSARYLRVHKKNSHLKKKKS